MEEIKIYINQNKVFELSNLEVKVLKNQIDEEDFDKVIKNWATSIFEYRLRNSIEVLINRWTKGNPSLLEENGIKYVPTNQYELIQLIIDQPNYEEITNIIKNPCREKHDITNLSTTTN